MHVTCPTIYLIELYIEDIKSCQHYLEDNVCLSSRYPHLFIDLQCLHLGLDIDIPRDDNVLVSKCHSHGCEKKRNTC